jgi:hypothetical protein
LIVPDPVQIALLYRGLSINHILLEKSSTTKDVVVVHVNWTRMKTKGIIQQLGDFFCSLLSPVIDIERDVKMPALLARREEKNIVKG